MPYRLPADRLCLFRAQLNPAFPYQQPRSGAPSVPTLPLPPLQPALTPAHIHTPSPHPPPSPKGVFDQAGLLKMLLTLDITETFGIVRGGCRDGCNVVSQPAGRPKFKIYQFHQKFWQRGGKHL